MLWIGPIGAVLGGIGGAAVGGLVGLGAGLLTRKGVEWLKHMLMLCDMSNSEARDIFRRSPSEGLQNAYNFFGMSQRHKNNRELFEAKVLKMFEEHEDYAYKKKLLMYSVFIRLNENWR